MKNITKFYVFVLALMVSFGMMAQEMSDLEFQVLQQKAQQEMAEHGPSLDVPYEPNATRATGDDCTDPLVINVADGMGTWSTYGETTCGRVDDYDAAYGTCINPTYYSNGEDLVFKLVVADDMWLEFNFDPVETYSSIWVMENCPDFGSGNTCLVGKSEYANTQKTFQWEFTSGTYYIQVDSWPSPDCITFDLWIDQWIPPPPADPITNFPYFQDLGDCTLPSTMQLFAGSEAHAVVTPQADYDDGCGVMLDGNSFSGFYHEYNNNCDNAFNNNFPDHTAQIKMNYTPDGTAGSLQLDFMFALQYSFADYYSWFRVTVDGNVLTEKTTGEQCIRGDIDWTMLVYDLSAYQTTGQNYDLVIDFVGKYYVDYYNGGDVARIDNVHLWFVPAGNVEGTAYDGDMMNPLTGVEIGFLGDDPPQPHVLTDGAGYYKFSNIPTEPEDHYDMYGFLDGMNYVEQSAIFVTGVTITLNWNMASPLMVITPAVLEETMNPFEWRSVPITITNGPTGGPLHWTAEIEFGEPPTGASMASVTDPSKWSQNNPGTDDSNFEESVAILGGAESANRDITEYMDCTMEENLFSAVPMGTTNGQAFEDYYGWQAGQHFTLTDDKKIGFMDFWVIATSPPTPDSEILIEFWEDGGSPSVLVASFTAFLTPLPTGEFWSGSYQFFRYSVEFPEAVDLEVGWVTLQRMNGGSPPNPIMYWANTTATSEPSWHSAGTSVGPYAMCLGGGAGGGWLDLSAFEGDVLPGESNFVSALFDASDTEPGQVWTADIKFTAQPNISTATVDVSMIIAGESLIPVDEFEAELVNMVTGQVDMSWSFANNDITFEYFLIRRDGAPIANTQNYSYVDILPTYGEFCYTVSAVYTEGESVPAGPECVIWLIPELCYAPDPLYGEVWTGAEESFALVLENCGEGILSYEFTGFDDPAFSKDFVTGVSPYMGTIEEGETAIVMITFSAVGYGAGTYGTLLDLMTNELAPDNERFIACEMMAYTPATLYGTVVDCNDNTPIANVTVAAGNGTNEFFGETDATGNYEFYVDEGTYEVLFVKLGYLNFKVDNVFAPAGVMTEVNGLLCETPYPVQWVTLDPNEADTQALITWSLPMGPYEIIYDDGSAEEYFAWVQWGGASAVKFTPAGYPASVIGGRIYVGDGSFPVGATFLGAPMSIGVLDDDGPNGMPGTVLDSVGITSDTYGWQTFSLNGATLNDGDFYLVYWQTTVPPNSPPVGIDEENPVVYRSYTRQPGMDWQMSVYNDFMMRATIFGPGDNVVAAMADGPLVIPQKKDLVGPFISTGLPVGKPGVEKGAQQFLPVVDESADRDLDKYRVAFVDGFDPENGEMPWDGTLNLRGTTTNNFYVDNSWGGEPAGFYAYAVQAVYESNESVWAYSNVAAHKLDYEVTVNVTQCDDLEPSGATVLMMGHNYPYQMLGAITPASGTVVFDSVIRGMYDLSVNKLGYQAYAHPNLMINSDYTENVILQENAYPPRNLYVDPLTSIATWDAPVYVAVPLEGFEELPFPPAGWQNVSNSDGWERVEDGWSSGAWSVPNLPDEGGDWFTVAEDDSDLGDDCCTYLITPELNLTDAPDYVFSFLYFWDGYWGSAGGFVEYSTDGGATWEVLEQLSAVTDWTQHSIDISDLSGPDGESSVWIAFHYDDNGFWADGFAVDNVYIGNGPVETVDGYYVYLNDGFVAQTDVDTRMYQYGDLQYGQVYTAAVAALYSCNLSPKIYYTFTSSYLYPPRNLGDDYIYNTNEVPLYWNPPVTGDGVPMAPASQQDYVEGIYEHSIGRAPLNGVAVTEGGVADESFLSGYRAPEVYGISNDIPAYAWFDAEATGTVNQIGSWPGGGAFANAMEIDTDDPEMAFEVDNTGATRHVSLVDGSTTSLGNIGCLPNAMALDYTTGIYYATDGNSLFELDFDAVTSTNIGSLGAAAGNLMIGMTFNTDGELFMYDLVVNMMWSCDITTGSCTQIGGIGFDANFGQGMAWDDLNGQAVLSAFNSGSFACEYRIANLTTGNTTFVSNIGSAGVTQFGTICIPVAGGPPGGGGDIPDGLLSYNIYQDEMLVGNHPHDDELTPNDTVKWVHNPVDPGCYDYTVTAVYDLGVYGFPGQQGESYHEGPDTVCVVWGYDLPFMEMWDSGNFGFNDWTTDPQHNNWVISSQNGNGAPSAQFNWDPDPGAGYAISLTSAPLNADLYTEGDIWMDFEYSLNNRNSSGTEMLAVEVYDGSDWNQVASFANTQSFEWTPQHVKITDFAMSRVFKIRFTAMGENSFDVIRWNVDNIYVYRMCEAPSELDGDYYWTTGDDFGAEIWWEAPDIPQPAQGWIRWDDGVLFTGIGLTDGGDFVVAARWDAGMLDDYVGTSLTKITMAPNDDGYTNINMKVWKGADAGTLLWESGNVQPTPGIFNEYTIDPPVPLDTDEELWIGYDVLGQPASTFPAGADAGPAVAGYGDKISLDGVGWDNLSDFGLDYNWTLAAYVETLNGQIEVITPLVEDRVISNETHDLSRGDVRETGVAHEVSGTREFMGFNIYRQGPDDDEYDLIDMVPYEEGVLDYTYFDDDPFGDEGYPYEVCYQVTSVWESETDNCESMPATSVIPIYDYVCIMVTGIDNPLAGDLTALYPNPASDRVNVTSTYEMQRITVVNYVGQVVYDRELNDDHQITMNTSSYDAGVYVVRISTDNGIITKRLAITK